MLKVQKMYNLEYGDIPNSQYERNRLLIKEAQKSPKIKTVFDEIHRIRNIEYGHFDCVIYLLPKGSPRPKRRKENEIFYVKGAADNKKILERWITNNPQEIICTQTFFNCDIYIPTPKSMIPAERLLAEMGYIKPLSKPDFDNLAKTYSDMISGSIIYDDDQIIESRIRKFYSIKPRIELHIKYMKEYDSSFNKKKIVSRMAKYNNEKREN